MIDASKIRIYGTGVGSDVHANRRVSFIIDPQDTGIVKKIHSELLHRDGTRVNVALVDNGNETLTANYTAPEIGPYEVVFVLKNLNNYRFNFRELPPLLLLFFSVGIILRRHGINENGHQC